MKLKKKIALLSLSITILSVMISGLLIMRTMEESLEDEMSTNVLNISRAVAKIPDIIRAFEAEDPALVIQPIVESIRAATEDVEFIVVTDLEGIRYSHPNPARIGARFVGGDEAAALLEGKEYVSTAEGTLGLSTRGFTPIYNFNHERIGMVSVGILNDHIFQTKTQFKKEIYFSTFLGILIGLIGAVLLGDNIKRTLMGLEPKEIAGLFRERSSILEAIKEGIIAINEDARITLMNTAAKDILNFTEKDIIGRPIEEVLPNTDMVKVLHSGVAVSNEEKKICGTNIMINTLPVLHQEKTIGVIASFRDKSEVTALAEELTGFKMLVDSLRATTHEFMNKLHVILGFLQLKDYSSAEKFILDITAHHQEVISFIIKNIQDTSIAALLLGKYSAAKESAIQMNIHPSSNLTKMPSSIPSSLMITIIGNLLENAFDAVQYIEDKKVIDFLLLEKEEEIIISVKDNGIGIDLSHQPFIFQKGFTTKSDGRGIGLHLVKQSIDNLGGSIQVKSKTFSGTQFLIKIPKALR
ncbi:hypothetical protein CACET_c33720 [Clostridium aceticum]|uniref:histidine kinase n=1 Tax=Clostridium aceticum TaxID=84022 RepID=A0A0D8IEE1_9CLOT|nr:DcuS/MalK family sensor histidine kinase [Clostridium aceticum]AKL96815.1 hypothetical protein CACET_c33720 [Clostridium aceticum]KJF27566.1 hypothetical protein TZ02_07205 [Clostridium aceticum]